MNISKSTIKIFAGIGVTTLAVFGIINANATTTETIKEIEAIEYTTSTINDATIYEGETEVRQKGEDGSKEITYSVKYKNGKEVERTKQFEKIVKPARDEIIAKGTKQKPESTPVEIITPRTTTSTQRQSSSVRSGAICEDGTRSSATGKGACSHHGGVSTWLYD